MEDIDLRLYLIEELKRRKKVNSKYSLRGFANYLEISKSSLSEFLNGRRPIGVKVLNKIYNKLAIPQNVGKRSHTLPLNYLEATKDHLDIYTNWDLITLLALIKTDNFQNDSHWLSKKMKLNKKEIEVLIEKLKNEKIISINKNGRILINKINFHFSPRNIEKQLVIDTQKKLLEKHMQFIQEQDFSNRCFADCTIAIDPNDIPQIRQMITEFRNNLVSLVERKSKTNKTRVYNMCCSFGPFDSEL